MLSSIEPGGGGGYGGGGGGTVYPGSTLKGTVQTFDKLPTSGVSVGDVYEVTGSPDTAFVSYYVAYAGGTVWNETVKPGLQNELDPDTMPHALVREADGTFSFVPFTWAKRSVGDTQSNPNPGFIGRPIRDVFFYQNRLAFLYDTNAILSETGDFGNFWRMTVLQYLDSDVLDVSATSTQVAILRDAVPFNDGIMLFSDQTQFSMANGQNGLSATSVSIRPVTNYQSTARASPAPLGSEVYFASDQAKDAIIWEYARLSGADATTAANITAHVPRYVPTGVSRLIPASDLNALFVLTDGAPNSVFVYQFYWLAGQTKAQSAWHRWDLDDDATILSGTYVGGVLYLVVSRPGAVYLEKVDLQIDVVPDNGFPQEVYLDRRYFPGGIVEADQSATHYPLAYPVDVDQRPSFLLVRTTGAVLDPSSYVWSSATTYGPYGHVSVPGNTIGAPAVAGMSYTFSYRFTRPFMRHQDGSAITSGRTQARTLRVNFNQTTAFRARVYPYGDLAGRPVVDTDFSARSVGGYVPGSITVASGSHPIQVWGNATEAVVDLINDTPFPSAFQSAEWEVEYWNRASP